MPHPVLLGRVASRLKEFDGAFLFCADCFAVHRITGADHAPIFLDDGSAVAADDFQQFLAGHTEHQFEILQRSSDAEMFSHARWDPMCRVAWQVTNGETDFVITFGREDIDGPRRYAIAPGRMVLTRQSVEIDDETLHRVVDETLYPHSAPASKIEAVTAACRRLLAAVPMDELEPIDELRGDPNVQLAFLPESVAKGLCSEVLKLFTGADREAVLEVVESDLRHEIPLVRIARRYQIQTR